MHSDWLKFQVECRQNRERAERIKVIKRAKNIALFWTALLWGTGGLIILPMGLYIGFKVFGVIE
jgi:hypothetical protein